MVIAAPRAIQRKTKRLGTLVFVYLICPATDYRFCVGSYFSASQSIERGNQAGTMSLERARNNAGTSSMEETRPMADRLEGRGRKLDEVDFVKRNEISPLDQRNFIGD